MPRLAALLVAALAATTAPLGSQQPDPDTVRAHLHAYLNGYERELSTLVAEEHFTQWPMRTAPQSLNGSGGGGASMRDLTRARILRSEVAFVSLPGNAGWLGYREVREVQGKPVTRRGLPLNELLAMRSNDARERAMALLLESARHNLGAPRTINLPSLPLELLHLRNQGRFVIERTSRDHVGDCDAMRIDFRETVRPTLIRRPEGGDMPSRIAAWVEPDTGRLCRAEVRTKDAQLGSWFEAVVRVDFHHDGVLGLTVPWKMHEVFFDPPRGRGEGEATYDNYRRFTTMGRVVPPAAPAPG